MFRVNAADELPDDLVGTIGVTAGASAPEDLVRSVIDRLSPVHGVEEVQVTHEDEYFPPPRNLRELLGAIDAAATITLGLDAEHRPLEDRMIDASDVLESLASIPE